MSTLFHTVQPGVVPAELFPEPPLEPEKVERPATPLRSLVARVSTWNRGRLTRRRARRMARAVSEAHGYQAWIDAYDTLTPTIVESFKLRCRHLERRPLISVVMPVYNPTLDQLADAVRSVQAQIYGEWELCIADDASTAAGVAEWLTDLAQRDQRVRVVMRERNGHISEASNSALELARGDYVALLDQDDLLRPHSLLIVAEALNRYPDAALLYSDEDKIDERGRRTGHYFKSDWNPYLLRSHNMVSHLGVYRRSLVTEVGGFRRGFEGAQDYDLALRCCERIEPGQVVHLPFVLYHWRVHEKSTSGGLGAKPYARQATERALKEHLERCGIAGHAASTPCGYRIQYALPDPAPSVCIIVPTRNRAELLRACIASLLDETLYRNYEILIVDNGSDEEDALEYLLSIAEHPRVRVLRDDRPFNFSRLNNEAVRRTDAEFVCLLNNDIEALTPGWLDEMMSLATQPGVGAVGAKLLYPDGTVQHAGVLLGVGGVAAHAHKHFRSFDFGYLGRARLIQEVSAVTAACLVVRRDHYLAVGGLDEQHLAVAFNDVDFCLKLKEHGLRNVWTPYAVLYHHESVSRGIEDDPSKEARFRREADYILYRWERAIRRDPAYSPNLTLNDEQFNLAFPPRVSLADAYWYRWLPETA
jgi:glycosyltransferase involved in cell wall biosynthesis